jgi:Tol biopolymer transport system component
MTLDIGTRLGSYEILAPLGEGGMGEVYRARDTRLGRDVAIKALPEVFASDAERLARFEREAKLLASLSHPNIAGIHGLEEVQGHRYLVLEIVEGETLSARLARGPLPMDEALEVCRQIAAGVEAAHESGVVHRDLKPANVMLTPSGGVKVLDFGLAKGGGTAAKGADVSQSVSPTMTYAATSAGMILGTAAYMSPEQARGKVVDRRTDIWSFGCVLYECLAGRKLYDGETVSDLVAKILEREPDWKALPVATSQRVRDLLARCLRKDPRERLRDIGDARLELADALAHREGPAAIPAAGSARGGRVAWIIAGALAVTLIVSLVVLVPRASHVPGRISRLTIATPTVGTLSGDPGSFALSPDGRMLVYTLDDASGGTHLWLRPLDALESRRLEGTDGATFPFWSPDSRHVGYFAQGNLQRIPAAGGPVQTICEAHAGRGGAWSPQGVILFAPEAQSALLRVSASGGLSTRATVLDSTHGEYSHRFPAFLPDGRHFIYGTHPEAQGNLFNICVASLDDPHGRPLLLSATAAVFAPPGYLLFTRDQALLAQRIDLRALKMQGEPVSLSDQPEVSGSISLSPVASCTAAGQMLYGQRDNRPTDLVWVDRDGRRQSSPAHFEDVLLLPVISPAGDQMVANTIGLAARVWLFDLARGGSTKLPAVQGADWTPVWSADGKQVAVLNESPSGNVVLGRDVSSGAEHVLVPARPGIYAEPDAWSPDGRSLILSQIVKGHQRDLVVASTGAGAAERVWLGTPAVETGAAFSPDGRWLAYTSDVSGRREVYVDAFPEPRGPHRVSSAGTGAIATLPLLWWRKDGREIEYLGPDGTSVFVCDVTLSPDFASGPPHQLFTFPADARGVGAAPDGTRFMLLLPVGDRPPPFALVENWAAQLAGEK